MHPIATLALLAGGALALFALVRAAVRRSRRLTTRERAVEQLKTDFMATVSHEIRSPVTPIKGYADLLRRRGHALSEQERDACLEVISDRAEHLSRVVDELLLASRISAGDTGVTTLEAVDLTDLVRRTADAFADHGRVIALHAPASPALARCDVAQTVRVLSSLLSNAMAYSDEGSTVTAYVRAVRESVLVAVQDHGRGIPPDQLERVFDPFHRVEDPLLMTTGGQGLGLYIASRLTAAMGGTLTCRSTVDVGSVFMLRLPRATGALVPAPRQDGPHSVPTV